MPASWQGCSRIPATFTDGTSNTILFAEKYSRCGYGGNLWGPTWPDLWMPAFGVWSGEPPQVRPSSSECNPTRASSPFSGGCQVALADGSVRGVSPGISPQTWWAACTPDGGEVLGSDW
jgi:prepilin-type processing-associated H-X9-DG protein